MEITPDAKVGPLLDAYPELEDVLVAMAPPFRKLKNPFLRKSVAKVASLKHAAAVGGVPLEELINRLRSEVGQPHWSSDGRSDTPDYFSAQPEWFDASRVVTSVDENKDTDPNKMALVAVLKAAKQLGDGEILELVTTFLPAPGIDQMRAKGFRAWPMKADAGLVKTYFMKSPPVASEAG